MIDSAKTEFYSASYPFAQQVTYVEENGDSTSIYVIPNHDGAQKSSQKRTGGNVGYSTEVMVNDSDIEKVVPNVDKIIMHSPEKGENRTYKVSGIVGKTKLGWRLGLSL